MNGSLKKSFKILYGVCTCIIVLMVVCYFGISNLKETYSAGNCPTGYTDNGTNCSYKVEAYYDENKVNSSAPCTMGGTGNFISCSEKKIYDDEGDEYIKYYCVGTCYVSYISEGRCYKANHRYVWLNYNPGTPYVEAGNVSKDNCSGCESGYSEDNDGDCVLNSNCYICLGTSGSVSTGGTYKQSASSPGANCHLTSSTSCSGTPTAKKYECTLTDNSKVCVTAYDSAWASANVGETGTSCKEVTNCSSTPGGGTSTPSSSSSSSSSNSSSSSSKSSSSSTTSSSSSSNVDDNPKTGSVAIFMVWVIALGTLIYSFVYFRQSKFE